MKEKNCKWAWVLMVFFCQSIFAQDSWFTGPIIASSGINMGVNESYFAVYNYNVHTKDGFNRRGKLVPTASARSLQFVGDFSHGITNWLDMEFIFPYLINKHQGKSAQNVGDMQILLGYQVFTPPENTHLPNIRLTMTETIPTGRYEQLSPSLLGSDATGAGSYQTTFNLIFQRQFYPLRNHLLETRLIFGMTFPRPTQLHSFTSFGGVDETNGTLKLGVNNSIDLSGELAINRNLSIIMEAFYFADSGNRFIGTPGRGPHGNLLRIGFSANNELTLAPAIGYMFTENIGMLGGVWYSVRNQNLPDFFTPVMSFMASW